MIDISKYLPQSGVSYYQTKFYKLLTHIYGAIYCRFLRRIPAPVAARILGAKATKLVPKIFAFSGLLVKEVMLCFPQVTVAHILRYIYY
jgi:hypothetical protein